MRSFKLLVQQLTNIFVMTECRQLPLNVYVLLSVTQAAPPLTAPAARTPLTRRPTVSTTSSVLRQRRQSRIVRIRLLTIARPASVFVFTSSNARILGSPSSSSSVSSATVGAIVGGVVGGIVFLIIIVAVIAAVIRANATSSNNVMFTTNTASNPNANDYNNNNNNHIMMSSVTPITVGAMGNTSHASMGMSHTYPGTSMQVAGAGDNVPPPNNGWNPGFAPMQPVYAPGQYTGQPQFAPVPPAPGVGWQDPNMAAPPPPMAWQMGPGMYDPNMAPPPPGYGGGGAPMPGFAASYPPPTYNH
jgi:hypothetical protein